MGMFISPLVLLAAVAVIVGQPVASTNLGSCADDPCESEGYYCKDWQKHGISYYVCLPKLQETPLPTPNATPQPEDPCHLIDCPDGTYCDSVKTGSTQCYDECERNEKTCEPGYHCYRGECQQDDPCRGVRCMKGYYCLDGTCRDRCETIKCRAGTYCEAGECKDLCGKPDYCKAGEICTEGVCIDECKGVECSPEESCQAGHCISKCEQANCYPWQECVLVPLISGEPQLRAECQTVDRCASIYCDKGYTCVNGNCAKDLTCDDFRCGDNEECYLTYIECSQCKQDHYCSPIPSCRHVKYNTCSNEYV